MRDYNVAVLYNLDGVISKCVEPVQASTTTIALRVARRALKMRHPMAEIESSEIMFDNPTEVARTPVVDESSIVPKEEVLAKDYKLGEFRRVRADTMLGKIITSIQVGRRDLEAVAQDVGLDADVVEQKLKDARRTHGIDHVFSQPDEHISLLLPAGVSAIKERSVKPEKSTKVFKAPKLGSFSPVRAGTKLAGILADLDGTRTLDALAAAHGTDRQRMNGILRHGLATMHGIGHVVDADGLVWVVVPDGMAADDLVKAVGEPRAAKGNGRVQLKTQKAIESAAMGVAPPHLVITSVANAHRQKAVDKLEKLADDGDWDGVRAFRMNGIDTYSKMINRHRDLILAAHDARQPRAAE